MLIAATGLKRGRIYNGFGSNLTEYPPGQTNNLVGGYYYDFAGLMGLGPLYTTEWTTVICDGSTNEDDMFGDALDLEATNFDLDEVEDNTGAKLIAPGDKITWLDAEFRIGNPSYRDVEVNFSKIADDETSATNAWLVSSDQSLNDWLDAQVVDASELTDTDIWWRYRAYLRWSLHWAIYVVPLVGLAGQAAVEDLDQADLSDDIDVDDTEMSNPTPAYGPYGLLVATGAVDVAALNDVNAFELPGVPWLRLWEQDLQFPYLKRGHVAGLPYTLHADEQTREDANFPEGVISIDASTDEAPVSIDNVGQIEAPDTKATGKEVVLRIRAKLNYHCKADEMLVLHVQSGRARLKAPEEVATDVFDAGLVIASAREAAMGPRMTLHHWRVSAGVNRAG